MGKLAVQHRVAFGDERHIAPFAQDAADAGGGFLPSGRVHRGIVGRDGHRQGLRSVGQQIPHYRQGVAGGAVVQLRVADDAGIPQQPPGADGQQFRVAGADAHAVEPAGGGH